MPKLGTLKKGDKGKITSVGPQDRLCRRLLEMGLIAGSEVEVLHEAPISGDPISVLVRGGMIALRRDEANYVEVEVRNG